MKFTSIFATIFLAVAAKAMVINPDQQARLDMWADILNQPDSLAYDYPAVDVAKRSQFNPAIMSRHLALMGKYGGGHASYSTGNRRFGK